MTRPSSVEFSIKTKRAASKRADGKCEDCGLPFDAKNKPEFDHDKEVWEGGDNSLENCRVRGRLCCHRKKTGAATTRRKKADRLKSERDNIKKATAKIASRPFSKNVRETIEANSIGAGGHRAHIDRMAKAGKQVLKPWFLK